MERAEYGWKRLEIARKDLTLQEMAEQVWNGCKRLWISLNVWKWLKMAQKAWEWHEMAKIGMKWLEIAKKDCKFLEIGNV